MCTENSYKLEVTKAPIVLLHGWGMNRNIWRLILPKLEALTERPIITLDLPGYGDNLQVPVKYTLENLVTWLDGEISKPATIIGWSLGGLVAQLFAHTYPDKVIKLGLIGSTAKFMAEHEWPGIKPNVLELFASQLVKSHMDTIERFMAIQAMGSAHAKQDIKQIKELVLAANEPNSVALSAGLKILQEVDLRDAFSQLGCPIEGLFGRLDSLVPVKVVDQLTLLNPNFSVQVLAKASHAPFTSNPEEFLAWFEALN